MLNSSCGSGNADIMNRSRWVILIAVLCIATGAVVSWLTLRPSMVPSSMVPYTPIVMDQRQKLVDMSVLITPAHLDAMERVLKRYDEPFHRSGPTLLLIPRRLAEDRDLLWNFTTKASEGMAGVTP